MVGNNSRSKYFFMNKRKGNGGSRDTVTSSVAVNSKTTTAQKGIGDFFAKKRKSEVESESEGADDGKAKAECKRQRKEGANNKNLSQFYSTGNAGLCEGGEYRPTLRDIGQREEKRANEKSPQEKPAAQAKPTPLEKQVIELKEKYPKLLLFIECGYRYRFFGRDAEIAAAVLGITCHLDRMFMTASVPTFNGPGNYVRKLVEKGHKVGIVGQTETAAEKQATSSATSGKMFKRALTAVYSRTTMIGEDIRMGVSEAMAGDVHRHVKSMIMVVHEVGPTTTLVAVQPSSGQILYDEFADDASKRMLEQRLEVIEPLEIILPKSIALRTKDAIKFYRDSSSDGCITVEETDDAMFATGAAKLQDVVDGLEGSRGLVQLLPNLSDSVSAGLYVLLEFLKQFGMEAAIVASENLEQVATAAEQEDTAPMKLPAITIRNLEIFQTVASNDCGRGTLFHAINRTKTRPGARMLKDWISQPLTSTAKILSRQEVVGHLIRPDNGLSVTFRKTLSMVMDLEVALMATLYKKVRPTDFVRLCEAMVKLHRMAETSLVEDNGGKLPPLLDKILKDVESNFAKSLELARRIDPAAAKEEKWDRIFWDWGFSPVVAEKREEIAELVESLEEHKKDIMKAMGLFSFQYTTVSGLEYLVEVKQNASRSVPSEWTKMNSTKQVSRYRTAFICLTLPKLQYSRECLAAECKKAWREFLDAEFLSDGFSGFQLGAKRVAELDCLVSLADLAREEGFCAPVFNTEGRVTVRKGRNLVVEKSLSIHEQFVPNDIVLDSQAGSRALVLTGPNMGGKSCYLRQLGTIAIMAQIGGYVPAEEASMPIFDALFVRIGARDDMWARKSTLMVELEDASLILRDATENSLVLIDELGRGTSTNDGSAIAKAVLENLVNEIRCLTVFVTHYRSVSDMENQFKGSLTNGHMGYKKRTDDGPDTASDSSILFLYQLWPGQAESSFGMNVARMAGLPDDVVELATRVSDRLGMVKS